MTVRTTPDTDYGNDMYYVHGSSVNTINIHKILNLNGASETQLENISATLLTALFGLKRSLLMKTLFMK